MHTRLITCASPEYLKEHGVPSDPQQLRDHKLIGALSNTSRRLRKWVFQKGSSRGRPISIVYPATHRQSPKIRVFAAFAAQLLEDYRLHVDKLLALRA